MKNKFMIKAGSLLLAGVMMTPLFVSADSQTCTGTARYYFSDEEVIENCGANGYGYEDYVGDADNDHWRTKCGERSTQEANAQSFGVDAFTFTTKFPRINSGYNITSTTTNIVISESNVKEWLDAVYATIYDSNINDTGAVVEKKDSSGNKLDIYLHGSWSQKNQEGGKISMSKNNPVYEAGIVRGLKDYDANYERNYDDDDSVYREFVKEVADSNIVLDKKDVSSILGMPENNKGDNSLKGVNVSFAEDNIIVNVYRFYGKQNIVNLGTVKPVDLSKWSIFQHYDKTEGCFINPVTAACFGEGNDNVNDSEFAGLNLDGAPTDDTQKLYLRWLFDETAEGSYQKYINTCHKYDAKGKDNTSYVSEDTMCRKDGGYGEENVDGVIEIWTPGGSTWINNIVYVDKAYTYDCSTGGAEPDNENEEPQPPTGIPSYGYLAIILAGAAGVYVIAKKRNKFIKF